jgi:hypothetical protein
LIAKDESDVVFLLPLPQAQCERIAWEHGDLGSARSSDVTTVKPAGVVAKAADELLESSDILFIHRDRRESSKIDELRARTSAGARVVGAVPVRETEARALAAACTTTRQIAELDARPPEKGLKWVEKISDPKAEPRRRYRGRRSVEDLFTLIAERADLDRPAEDPAYQSFLQDLTTALKELNFL